MKFRKITSLFLATTMAVSSIFSSTSVLAAEKASITEGLEEGSVGVKRNAEWVSNDTIKVDVRVDGVPKKEGIDAILIVDISGSMNTGTTGETYIPWSSTGTTPIQLGLRNKATRQASETFINTLYKSDADNRLAYGFFGTNSYDSSVIELKEDSQSILRGTLNSGKFDSGTSKVGDGTIPLKGDNGFISKNDTDFTTTNQNMILHAKNQLASEGTAYSKGVQLAKHYMETRENKNRPVSIVFMSDGENSLDGEGVLNSEIQKLKDTDEYKEGKLDLNTVALDLSTQYEQTLKDMNLGDGQLYKTLSSDISSLSTAFETIVNRSQKAGTNAKITEKIAPEFELVDNPKAPEATTGTITKGTNELSWDLGNITTKTETMTYYIKVKDTTETGKEYLVTGGASIEYNDVNGEGQNKNTDEYGNRIPYEDIKGEIIYKDVNGNEIGRETVSGKPGSIHDIPVLDKLGYMPKTDSPKTITLDRDGNNVIEVIYVVDPNQKFGYEIKYYLEGTKTPVPGINVDLSKFPNAKYDSTTGILSGTAPIETEIEALKLISNKGYKALDTTVEKIKVTTNSDLNKKTVYYGVDDSQKFEYTIRYIKTGSNGSVLEEVKGSEALNKTIDIEIKSFKGLVLETTPQKQLKISNDSEKNIVEIRYKNDPSALYGYEVVSFYNDGVKDVEIGRVKSTSKYQADSVAPVIQPKIEGYTIKSGQATSIVVNGDESQNIVRLEYTINKYKYEVSLLDQYGKPLIGLTKADLELLNPGKSIEYDPTTGKLTGIEEYGKEVSINLPTVSGYTTSDTVAKITIDYDESKNKSVVEYKSDYRNIIVKYKLSGKDVDLKAPVNTKLENTYDLTYSNVKNHATGHTGDIAPSKLSLYSYRSSTVFLAENTIVLYYK